MVLYILYYVLLVILIWITRFQQNFYILYTFPVFGVMVNLIQVKQKEIPINFTVIIRICSILIMAYFVGFILTLMTYFFIGNILFYQIFKLLNFPIEFRNSLEREFVLLIIGHIATLLIFIAILQPIMGRIFIRGFIKSTNNDIN